MSTAVGVGPALVLARDFKARAVSNALQRNSVLPRGVALGPTVVSHVLPFVYIHKPCALILLCILTAAVNLAFHPRL